MTSKTAPDTLRIAMAQLNPIVGDVAGNLAKAREARADAARQGADLVLFTELFLCGYPPEDLVLKPAFLVACERAARDFAADTADGGPGFIDAAAQVAGGPVPPAPASWQAAGAAALRHLLLLQLASRAAAVLHSVTVRAGIMRTSLCTLLAWGRR